MSTQKDIDALLIITFLLCFAGLVGSALESIVQENPSLTRYGKISHFDVELFTEDADEKLQRHNNLSYKLMTRDARIDYLFYLPLDSVTNKKYNKVATNIGMVSLFSDRSVTHYTDYWDALSDSQDYGTCSPPVIIWDAQRDTTPVTYTLEDLDEAAVNLYVINLSCVSTSIDYTRRANIILRSNKGERFTVSSTNNVVFNVGCVDIREKLKNPKSLILFFYDDTELPLKYYRQYNRNKLEEYLKETNQEDLFEPLVKRVIKLKSVLGLI